MNRDREWFETDLLDRFLSYVTVHTTSVQAATEVPSSPGQRDLAQQLHRELEAMGVSDVVITDQSFLIARVPGTADGSPVGFMAHLDTSPDMSGEGVKPQVHRAYDGGVLEIGGGYSIDPAEFPALRAYAGQTIITSDGTTLLGADDKAGIAEIMTALRYLLEHPEIPRPPLEILFTPDEETGHGMDVFPRKLIEATCCYTLDGSEEGEVENETFSAYRVVATFNGRSIHPGTARGKLANAVSMAAHFVSLLPRSESPEATDGRYGFYCPTEISGGIAGATVAVIVRDFDLAVVENRVEYLEAAARLVEGAFPGGSVSLEVRQQYLNMAEGLRKRPEVVERAMTAIRQTGMEPAIHSIRGGTDGARLTELGVPTPNLFTGGHNYHGRLEWVALPAMVRAAKTVINLVQLFAEGADQPT